MRRSPLKVYPRDQVAIVRYFELAPHEVSGGGDPNGIALRVLLDILQAAHVRANCNETIGRSVGRNLNIGRERRTLVAFERERVLPSVVSDAT